MTDLVDQLSRQLKEIAIPLEIILIDDGSSEAFRKQNEQACRKEVYIPLDKNVGRAKVRNLFLEHARYDHLLFLDCDSLIVSENFIPKYIAFIQQTTDYAVVCGGRIYDKNPPERSKALRWKYGIQKESQSLSKRRQSPNKSFMTNNFLIRRNILEQVKFDERIQGYGHEDTLFGYMLKKKGIVIHHIDNPVLNGDLEENIIYLQKTEEGIRNLLHILSYVSNDPEFIEDVTLLQFYKGISKRKLSGILYFFFSLFKPLIRFLLSRGYISLWLFDFYKLGIFMEDSKRRGSQRPDNN